MYLFAFFRFSLKTFINFSIPKQIQVRDVIVIMQNAKVSISCNPPIPALSLLAYHK
ncbi:hypothetical protein SBF1_50024 [Candidatus Desulfosporosinus infrequens]|uniref:Uncharacterized protein n=1 Tax=Candidatus Desulfosporosinus infrequens TaxID=2043169 RepID=A0A2U3LH25_9FIRM|nr:hypothetical protein SBF1_50024 [Candidatus Desulfosporosinus infrequens]